MTQVESKKRDSMKSKQKKSTRRVLRYHKKKKKKKKKKKNPYLAHYESGEGKMYSPWRSKMTAK